MRQGRGLVAVPRDGYRVFLSWRLLAEDQGASFEVLRASGEDELATVGVCDSSTTFVDQPGVGAFRYVVVPQSGAASGKRSRFVEVATRETGCNYVEIRPPTDATDEQMWYAVFADTNGDGELELLLHEYSNTILLNLYDLGNAAPRWTWDSGIEPSLGRAGEPASGESIWHCSAIAADLDGDGHDELFVMSKRDGEYGFVVLRDAGDHPEVAAWMPSPRPVDDRGDWHRYVAHPFHGALDRDSVLLYYCESGVCLDWRTWVVDLRDGHLVTRWSTTHDQAGPNPRGTHYPAVGDFDGDGLDEICVGTVSLDHDGTVLWRSEETFGAASHIDSIFLADIDERNPGLELLLTNQDGDNLAVFDAASGAKLMEARPGNHIQCALPVNISNSDGNLDILGNSGDHKMFNGGFCYAPDGRDLGYPLQAHELPYSGNRFGVIDWDGGRGHNLLIHRFDYDHDEIEDSNEPRVYGPGGSVLLSVEAEDIRQSLNYAVDLFGDHREEVIVMMRDGSIRAYLNTDEPPAKKPTKLQDPFYRRQLGSAMLVKNNIVHPDLG